MGWWNLGDLPQVKGRLQPFLARFSNLCDLTSTWPCPRCQVCRRDELLHGNRRPLQRLLLLRLLLPKANSISTAASKAEP